MCLSCTPQEAQQNPAGPGRPGPRGHGSLMNASFTEKETGKRGTFGRIRVLLVLEKMKMRAGPENETTLLCVLRITDLSNGPGGQDGQS